MKRRRAKKPHAKSRRPQRRATRRPAPSGPSYLYFGAGPHKLTTVCRKAEAIVVQCFATLEERDVAMSTDRCPACPPAPGALPN